jgi:carbon-monoxide dehydrogenase large subunit
VVQLADGSPLTVPPRHALADDRVRHVGDPVALVLAHTRAAAQDAAQCVDVDYEALPALTDPAAALEAGATQLWPQAPGNLAFHFRRGDADATRAAFAGAAHVVELAIANQRVMVHP